jgi:hypothetical protein
MLIMRVKAKSYNAAQHQPYREGHVHQELQGEEFVDVRVQRAGREERGLIFKRGKCVRL